MGFSKKAGIDDVAHFLEHMDGQINHGAEIEILTDHLPDEVSRVMNYYPDGEDNYISKEKAVKVRTYGFSKEGKILSFHERLIKEDKA
ncbi:MAG: hypothetical protein HFJ06_08895 [Lachnospiraceae bacterium]|nr:hypothetical protein [Lachnospiraceae bacterium]